MSRELLQTFERAEGTERVAVYWRFDGQSHVLELARERKTVDGWALLYRTVFTPGEVFLLGDAVLQAADLAATVRR